MTNGINVIGDNSLVNLRGTGGDDSFSGSDLAEVFYTGMGNDMVFAGAGSDTVIADLGNDWLEGSTGTDTVDFSFINYISGANSVANDHGFTFDLTKTSAQKMGYLGTKTILGFENVVGSYGNDKIYGSAADNDLSGGAGNDLLDGRAGRDTLIGIGGQDTLIGGKGADELWGGTEGSLANEGSRDTFVYKSVSDNGLTPSTSDTVFGFFNGGGTTGDKIDLSAIDANGSASGNGTFKYIGAGNFHSNSTGEVQVTATGNTNEYLVRIDVDTDNAAESIFYVYSTTALVKGDFVL